MVNLGDKVTDSVTGFTGIATQRTTYLTGCDQIRVVGRCVDDQPAPFNDFDEDRLLASVRDLAIMKTGIDSEKVSR